VLMRNPKSRLRLKPVRGRSGSNSGLASPSPTTPPPMGVGGGGGGGGGGYFGKGAQLGIGMGGRGDSLSQVVRDSFSEEGMGADEEEKQDVGTEPSEAVKRVVTRRGNLLVKPLTYLL